jgi:predicted nucleic acid-binding protein
MILYVDTSALVKKYFSEAGSSKVIKQWKKSGAIATSSIAYAETMASFHRKKREANIRHEVFHTLVDSFQRDWESLFCVQVNDDLNDMIDKVLSHHPLRGLDAIHLASALTLQEAAPEQLVFACFDKTLVQAAIAEGLRPLPSPNLTNHPRQSKA